MAVHVRHGVDLEVRGERLNGHQGEAMAFLRVVDLVQEVVDGEVLGDLLRPGEVNLINNFA